MTYEAIERLINRLMPNHLKLTAGQYVPLYLLQQGAPKRYRAYIVGIDNGHATSSFDNHDDFTTENEALRAGMRLIINYLNREP